MQGTCLIKGWCCFYSGEFTKSVYAQVTLFEKHSLEDVGVVIVSTAIYFGPSLELCFLINSRRNECMVYVLL